MTNLENKMTAQFKFMGYAEDEILFDVQPIVQDTIEFEISIRPKNNMTAIYDLVETPTISLPVHPVEDTYISTDTPYNSINNGDKRSFLIGKDIKGEHRGLIKFDISSLDSSLLIKNAKLRIYYSNLIPDTILNLYTVNGEWSEYSATFLNKPNVKDFVTSDYVINEIESYIEFDVSSVVSNWIKGIPNDGFYLSSSDFASTFRSRESSFSPILFVDYKDPAPYKISYSKLEFEVNIKELADDDIEFGIEVGETYSTDDIEFEVFAHNPNHTYTEDVEFEVNAVEIIPTQIQEDIEWDISVAIPLLNQTQWEILIPEYNLDSDVEFEVITIFNDKSVIDFEIIVNEYDKSDDIEFDIDAVGLYTNSTNDIEFEIIINEYSSESNVEFELFAQKRNYSDIDYEIIVNEYNGNSDTEFEIGVWKYDNLDIEFDINVFNYESSSSIEFEIGVQGYEFNSIEWEVYIPHSDIEFDVTPLFSDDNTIEFEVNPRVYYISDIEFEVTVPIYLDDTEIEWDTTIRAVRNDDVEFEIEVKTRRGYAYAFII